MARLLPVDCLNEIFENLEDDKPTLHSCLLVNRLWCEISVRILWKDIWIFLSAGYSHEHQISAAIVRTLIACLPNESKEILRKNKIILSEFSAPTLKSPMFNYAAFCKVLPINTIYKMVENFFLDNPTI